MPISRRTKRALNSVLSAVVLGLLCFAAIEFMVLASGTMVRPPLEGIENQVIDLAFQVRKQNPAHKSIKTEDVVIIDLDDASIRELGRPQSWPRSYDARVINYIASGHPKAIGVDYLYTETDSLTAEYANILAEKGYADAGAITSALSTDHALSAAINDAGNVYLSLFNDDHVKDSFVSDEIKNNLRLLNAGEDTTIRFPLLDHPVLPIRSFADAAKATGTIDMTATQDGTVRFYPLLHLLPDSTHTRELVANFPFYMVIDELGVKEEDVKVTPDGLQLGSASHFIPLRKDGSFRVNWLGSEEKIRSISYYKIWDELVPAEFFENKYVFLGTSASGLQDLKTVPSKTDKMPGVEVHAIAFLNMMNQAFFNEVTEEEAMPWFALTSILLVFVFLFTRPLFGFVVAILLYFGERFFFELWVIPKYGIIFPITTLMLLTLLTYLSASLFIYFIREKKNRRLKSAFGTYVSPDIVDRIVKDPGVLHLGGEKKELTVLFSDIRSFTAYSEMLDPQQIVAVLNAYLSSMSDIIFQHKGTIDKFIGDAIMAIFGAPIPQKDHADRACRVAIDMINELKVFNVEQARKGQPPLQIGIGLNTGDMTVGNIGSAKRFDYTVIGDSVNIGSRLEGLTKFFGIDIVVSESTLKACTTSEFTFRELGPVILKGKDEPVVVYQLMHEEGDQRFASWLETWNNAMMLLKQSHLAPARDLFRECLAIHPDDIPTSYYISSCEEFMDRPGEFELAVRMESK